MFVESVIVSCHVTLDDKTIGLDTVRDDGIVRGHSRWDRSRGVWLEEEHVVSSSVVDELEWDKSKPEDLQWFCHAAQTHRPDGTGLSGSKIVHVLTHRLMDHVGDTHSILCKIEDVIGLITSGVCYGDQERKLKIGGWGESVGRCFLCDALECLSRQDEACLLGEGDDGEDGCGIVSEW